MTNLSVLNPTSLPNATRLAVIAGSTLFLVALGFLVPFWIVLLVAAGMIAIARVLAGVRAAARRVDQILAEELPRMTQSHNHAT